MLLIEGKRIHTKIPFLVFLTVLFIGLPTSKFLMTVAQLAVLFFWMIDGIPVEKVIVKKSKPLVGAILFLPLFIFQILINVFHKIVAFFNNKPALIFSSIFFLHIIGLLWTNHDFAYAFKDLRIKLPLLYFPIVFATATKLDWKVFKIIFGLYLATILVSTFYGFYLMLVPGIVDSIELSPFISHIRFSLNILLAIGVLFYFSFTLKMSKLYQFLVLLISVWFTIYLVMMESLTGVSILMAGIIVSGGYYVFHIKHKGIKVGIISAVFLFLIGSASFILSTYNDYITPKESNIKTFEKQTSRGNRYSHDTIRFGIENGYYVGAYICYSELENSWNQRSEIKFDQIDKKFQKVKYTLIRYLNSKGMRKDQDAVMALTNEDVMNIENGLANAEYAKPFSVKKRLYRVFYGFRSYTLHNNPNRSSMMQRIEYWKTSVAIIGDHPLFGVGTGDMDYAFNEKYTEMKTPLTKEWRRRSHNQYLAIMVAFGVFGLIWFLAGLIIPPILNGSYRQPLFVIFLFIGMFSMLWEDTLESQAGLTFMILIYCVFCFGIDYKTFTPYLTDKRN
ncbi:MAG: O-antigen ligase family protein [Bacteroidales bacterium]|nr:O-antigen ligase family protein [Bacteroidales bacterium]